MCSMKVKFSSQIKANLISVNLLKKKKRIKICATQKYNPMKQVNKRRKRRKTNVNVTEHERTEVFFFF